MRPCNITVCASTSYVLAKCNKRLQGHTENVILKKIVMYK